MRDKSTEESSTEELYIHYLGLSDRELVSRQRGFSGINRFLLETSGEGFKFMGFFDFIPKTLKKGFGFVALVILLTAFVELDDVNPHEPLTGRWDIVLRYSRFHERDLELSGEGVLGFVLDKESNCYKVSSGLITVKDDEGKIYVSGFIRGELELNKEGEPVNHIRFEYCSRTSHDNSYLNTSSNLIEYRDLVYLKNQFVNEIKGKFLTKKSEACVRFKRRKKSLFKFFLEFIFPAF